MMTYHEPMTREQAVKYFRFVHRNRPGWTESPPELFEDCWMDPCSGELVEAQEATE